VVTESIASQLEPLNPVKIVGSSQVVIARARHASRLATAWAVLKASAPSNEEVAEAGNAGCRLSGRPSEGWEATKPALSSQAFALWPSPDHSLRSSHDGLTRRTTVPGFVFGNTGVAKGCAP
jgi:hypothetical protein